MWPKAQVHSTPEDGLARIGEFHREVEAVARRYRLGAYVVMGCASYRDGMVSHVAIGGESEAQKRSIPAMLKTVWDYCCRKSLEEGEGEHV